LERTGDLGELPDAAENIGREEDWKKTHQDQGVKKVQGKTLSRGGVRSGPAGRMAPRAAGFLESGGSIGNFRDLKIEGIASFDSYRGGPPLY